MADEFEPPGKLIIRRVFQSLFEALFGRDPRSQGTKKSGVHEISRLLRKAKEKYKSHQFDVALKLNQQALLLSKYHHFGPGESLSLCQLAANEIVAGDYESAKEHANAGLEIMRRIDDPYKSNALLTLGIACRELGEFSLAMSYLSEAEEMVCEQIKALDERSQNVNFLREDLADIYLAMGNVALYLGDYREATDKIRLSWQGANLYQDKARAHTAAIDLVYAYIIIQDWDKAISILMPVLGFNNPLLYEDRKWAILLDELDKQCSQITSYSRTTYVFYMMRGYACQITHKTHQALIHYETILELLETARSKLKNSVSRIMLLGPSLTAVALVIKLALDTHKKVLAYEWIERFRSRTMLDMLGFPIKYRTEGSIRFYERWSGGPPSFSEIQSLIEF